MRTTADRELERRGTGGTVELRAANESGSIGVLVGYAAVFGKISENLGGFVEKVDPAAFNKTLMEAGRRGVMARFNHDSNCLLGTTNARTLRLAVDKSVGLRYEVDLPDTSVGHDVRALAERGDLHFSSFAFRTIRDQWDYTEDGTPLRTLLEVQLVDVAPVADPAYRDTTTGLRGLAERLNRRPEEVAAAAAAGNLRSLTPRSATPAGQLEILRRRLDLMRWDTSLG